jgi:Na+-driven multidrug efflux pump
MAVPAQAETADVDLRTRELLEAPLIRLTARLAAPNALVMMTTTCIGLIELYFVAKLGVDSLAGVSQVFAIVSLISALSQGAVGGGVVSAVARALGKGQRQEANDLVWYAIAIAVPLGLVTTAALLIGGPSLYTAMGARDGSLQAALRYSNLVFGSAVLTWLFYLLLAVVRGTGNLVLSAAVVCGGALLLVPLLPVLIIGWGPVPGLGIIGGAVGMLSYFAIGSLVFATYLWGGWGVLRPPIRPPRFSLRPIWQILRVGGMSALISGTTSGTIAILTGFVGAYGVAAVAGYATGARLEFLLPSLSYGIGGPVGILVGTNIGAGNIRRAVQAAWIGVAFAAIAAEAIGLVVAIWPDLWIRAFSDDPTVLAVGATYLRTVGPFFGFFGAGFALYMAGQGTGHLQWPASGALARAAIGIAGGLLAFQFNGGLAGIFVAAAIGMATFGSVSVAGLVLRAGYQPPWSKATHPAASTVRGAAA